jgi:hypothetical protein
MPMIWVTRARLIPKRRASSARFLTSPPSSRRWNSKATGTMGGRSSLRFWCRGRCSTLPVERVNVDRTARFLQLSGMGSQSEQRSPSANQQKGFLYVALRVSPSKVQFDSTRFSSFRFSSGVAGATGRTRGWRGPRCGRPRRSSSGLPARGAQDRIAPGQPGAVPWRRSTSPSERAERRAQCAREAGDQVVPVSPERAWEAGVPSFC